MKLAGYIREFKEVMFTVPIYKNGSKYYFHTVDDHYSITGFEEISDPFENLIELDGNLEFKAGGKGAVVFRGKGDFIVCDRLAVGIPKVRRYFRREIEQGEFVYAEEDVQYFESLISSLNSLAEVRQPRESKRRINLSSMQYILNYLKKDIKNEEFNESYVDLIISMYDQVFISENRKAAVVEFKNSVGRRQAPKRGLIYKASRPIIRGVRSKTIRYNVKRYIAKREGFSDMVIFLKSIIEDVVESEKSIR